MRISSKFSELDACVRKTIRQHAMLRAGDRVGIAISGGADSVALALFLQRIQSHLAVSLFLAHFNHQLRGAESDADEKFVRDFAAQLGLEFVSGRDDVALRARERGWNIEAAARRLRYSFFAILVQERRATRIAVAHTADDQAETLFAQMIRGTGPAGLAGIYPVAEHVIRPLLAVRRATLREFLLAEGQAWREDLTNNDETRLRARIRHRLLPLLAEDFQPRIVDHLGRLADLAREDESFWTELVEDRFRALVTQRDTLLSISVSSLIHPITVNFSRGNLQERHANAEGAPSAALTKRLIRRILADLKGTRAGFASYHVDDVLALATHSSSGCQIHLPAGIVVEKSFGDLIFSRPQVTRHTKSGDKSVPVGPRFVHDMRVDDADAATVDVPEIGHRVRLKVIDWPAATRETSAQAIDWACLRAPLVVRNWQPGDAFQPHGRLREHKLKELLRVKRVPVRDRATWPVLTSAGSVVWARGFPVAKAFAACASTRRSVVVVEEPL